MAHINISFNSDELTTESGQHLSTFLASLKQVNYDNLVKQALESDSVAEPVQEEKPKATRNRSKKVEEVKEEEPAIDQEAVNQMEVVKEDPETEEDDFADAFPPATMEQINQQIQLKKGIHKDAIKAEFPKYGINAVRELKPEQYGEFYAFLNGLTIVKPL